MKKTIFTGGYTQTSKGIYICEFDDRSASVSIREIEEKCENPNFIAANWRKGFLCALNEDEANTWITLYRISDTKKLVLLDSIEVGGKGPCHISIDENGRRVFFANYESGDIGMVLIGENGKFSKNIKRVYHQGGSVSERQKSAHPHGVHILRREELAVPDLGLDQIRIYDISGYDMKLKDIVQVKTGDGPGMRYYIQTERRCMLSVNYKMWSIRLYPRKKNGKRYKGCRFYRRAWQESLLPVKLT